MNTRTLCRAFVVSCAVAAAAACNNSPNANNSAANGAAPNTPGANTAAQARDRHENKPVALDGCLQKGSSGTYLLTRLNEPAHKNLGSTGPASAVEQEQLWLARNEYRIDPAKDVNVDDLVGKQVHVTGTLVDAADLPTAQQQADRDVRTPAANTPTATSGTVDRNANGADIKQGDLAKIDASAVSMIAASCGSEKPAGTSGKASKAPAAKAAPGKTRSSK